MKRKICLFTSTRADWGLLRGVAAEIRKEDTLELTLLVSGSHLSERLGNTYTEIEADGFPVEHAVDILDDDDSPLGTCRTMGRALTVFAEALESIRPDMLLVLGDRYETFCLVAAAQVLMIPVAHIHGGETTEGAVDEAFRHSITKMSHLHFPTCEAYRRRIVRMGENPAQVHNVGALGVENIQNTPLLSREELSQSIGFSLECPYFLVTFHPVTLEKDTSGAQFDELIAALEKFREHRILFTKANADTNGQRINRKIDDYVKSRGTRCLAVASLGLKRYLSVMNYCDAVVGNSSSGILEAPVFRVPTVNIGDRQKGRIRVASILDCRPDRQDIWKALRKAIDPEFRESLNRMAHPCAREGVAYRITEKLISTNLVGILKKAFYDLGESEA